MTVKWSVAFVISLVAVTLPLITGHSKPSLNARRVLLPYNLDVPTNYTLEVLDGGCYRWTSSRPDVASVSPIIELDSEATDCSSRAVITAVSRSKKRQAAVILAVDGGVTLRADVEVDSIKFIEIITTTREIALDDVPEIFEVHAKNDQNNTFTTLGGIEFEWDLKPIRGITTGGDNQNEAVSNLRFRKFSELSYKLDKQGDNEFWEVRDRRGSVVLIEGVRTGASRVVTRIRDSAYADVAPSEIQLLVIANIYLVPSDSIYLIPSAQISYSVNILKGQQMKQLPLPTEQYFLQVTDPKIASLDALTSTVTGEKEGTTTLVLKDRNIKPGIGLRQPTAEVFVTKPSYMTFYIRPASPGKEWFLQEKTPYVVTLDIFDSNHHRVFPSPNLVLNVIFPPEFFKVTYSTQNGTYHLIETVKPGTTTIKASLEGASKVDGTITKLIPKNLSGEQEVNIYPELIVNPPSVFLPWDSLTQPTYNLRPSATGATGTYRWDSSSTGLLSVNFGTSSKESARPLVVTKGPGFAKLTARDANSHVFFKEVSVEITEIVDIKVIPGITETSLGSSVYLQLALYGKSQTSTDEHRVFDECSKIPLDIDIVEKTRFQFLQNPKEKAFVDKRACRALEFSCTSIGHSRVWITYTNSASGEAINTTAVISCFMPLKVVYPGKDGLIALGTSVEVAFEGGPRKWPMANDGHYASLTAANDYIFSVKPINDPYRYKKDLHVFRVSCQSLGETTLNLKVGNLPSPTLPNPAVVEDSVKLTCGTPLLMSLRPKMKKDDNCPLARGTFGKIPVSNSHPAEIEVIAKDALGRTFLNFSSVKMSWLLSDNIIAKMPEHRDFTEEVNGAQGYRRWVRNYQTIKTLGKEGDVVVSVIAPSYRSDVLASEGVTSYKEIEQIRSEVTLSLVNKPYLSPRDATLFNHRSNQAVLKIAKGSGHFHVESASDSSSTGNVTYNEATREVTVKPLADGVVTVNVFDTCVVHEPGTSSPDAQAFIRIVDPRSVRVSLNEKIELGKETEVIVEVIDSSGGYIPSKFHQLMNLHPIIRSDIISVRYVPNESNPTHSHYVVKGDKLGRASLVFATGSSDKTTMYANVVESSEVKIEVFSPLSIYPTNLKLIVGSTFEPLVTGGPVPDSSNEFSTSDSKILGINSGVIEAKKIGTTTLVVKSVGKNNLIYSEDKITVDVVPLIAIKINSPVKQIVTGSSVNLILTGIGPRSEVLDAFSFGDASPRLKITWSVSNTQLLDITSVNSFLGIHNEQSNNFGLRVIGRQQGTVTIGVQVEVTEECESPNFQIVDNRILHDNITLRISSALSVVGEVAGDILMTPGSELNLRSSRDGIARVSYSVDQGGNKIILEKNGLLKSLSSDPSSAVLEVRSEETLGLTQAATYGVRVQPISYLMLMPHQSLFSQPDKKLSSLPLGATITFDVNFHNILGQKFDVTNMKPHLSFSRIGLLSVSWGTSNSGKTLLHLTGVKEGTVTVKVWIQGTKQNEEISDFISLRVGQVIYPRITELTVGDIVCFSSPLTTPEGQSGSWSGTDSSLLEFLSSGHTGIAVGRRHGEVNVKHDISSFATTLSSPLQILPNTGVHLNTAHVHFLTSVPDSVVTLPVVVPGRTSLSAGCTPQHFAALNSSLFECVVLFMPAATTIKAADVFSCNVEFDNVKREHQATIRVKNDLSVEKQEALASLESSVHVSVHMIHAKVSSVPVILPFRPAFHLETHDLILTNHESHGHVVMSGIQAVLTDIQAEPVGDETRRILRVFPAEQIRNSEGRLISVRIPVAIKDRMDSISQTTHGAIQVRIFSSAIRQQAIIPVNVKWIFERGSQCIQVRRDPLYDSRSGWDIAVDAIAAPFSFILDNYQTITTILLLVVLGVASFLYFSKSRPPILNANFQGSNSSFHAPSLPPQGIRSPPNEPPMLRNGPLCSPFGAQRPLNVMNLQTTSANKRILSFEQHSSPTPNNGSPNNLNVRSPTRPTSSPKGITGRPLWTQQR